MTGANLPLLTALVEQAPDAIIYCDLEGTIEIWNRAATALFGHGAAQAIGKSLDMIIPERFRAAHWAGFRRAVQSGMTKYHGQVMTTRATHADGVKLYVDLSFGLIHDANGQVHGLMSIARINASRGEALAAAPGKTCTRRL